jgi:hypothetical protein
VRYYNRDQVDAIVVSGKACMIGGKPTGWDLKDLITQSMDVEKKTTSQEGIVRCNGPSSQYR